VVEAASSAQRDLSSKESGSILQRRGNVEARTITCIPTSRDKVVCEGSMVVHADWINFKETTGEIDARGNVRLIPYRPAPGQ
jgi:hypothetical protein